MLLLSTICRLKSCKIERMDIFELEDLTLLLILFLNHCLSSFLELSGLKLLYMKLKDTYSLEGKL